MKTKAAAILATLSVVNFASAQHPAPNSATPTPSPEPPSEVTPHHPDELARLREDWTPPGDQPLASSSGDSRSFLAHYLSAKSFAEIWRHYALKLGAAAPADGELPCAPNSYTQVFPRLGPRPTDGHATLTIKNVQFPEQTERGATLTRRDPNGRAITVFLATQGERTFVSVTIAPLH
jgi:hypothetical protein